MKAVKFGLVGLGVGAYRAREITLTEGAELIAVCDVDQERLDSISTELNCKSFTSFDKMLEDPEIEVVYLTVPSGIHGEFTQKAARANKHIVLTKPMELSVKKCEEIMQVISQEGVNLIVDLQTRYDTQLQQIKIALKNNEIGDIIFAEGRCMWWRGQDYYDARGGWRGTWRMDGGGSLANQGIHIVDLFIWLCGMPSVLAAKSGVYNHKIETEDLTVALLELSNGVPAAITTTTCYHIGDQFGVSIVGTKGSVSTLKGSDNIQIKFEDKIDIETQMYDTSTNIGDRFSSNIPDWPKSAIEDAINVLRKGRSPFISGEEGMKSVVLLEKIYNAAGLI